MIGNVRAFVLIIGLLNSCCPYDEEDLAFSINELNLISSFEQNDAVWFSSIDDTTENYIVSLIDTTIATGCVMAFSSHTISVTLSFVDDVEQGDAMIFLSKRPSPGTQDGLESELYIFFKDFSGGVFSDSMFSDLVFRSISLGGVAMDSVLEIKSNYMERKLKPTDITHIYWSAKCGIRAYKTLDGKLWINSNCPID